MKLNGQECSEEDVLPSILNLSEVVITAKPKKLRKIAKFLKRIAKEIERGNPSDHYHFNQKATDKPDIIVVNEERI